MAATAVDSTLLGPPAIRRGGISAPATAASSAAPPAQPHPFLDLLDAGFNAKLGPKTASPSLTLTENCSPTLDNSGDPLVDFFFQIVPSTPADTVGSLLAAAWAREPLTALKLVCHLRGVRGTGKADKESFYAAALWIHAHHPKTLAANVAAFVEFGYFKDLLEILYRIVHGATVRAENKQRRRNEKRKAARAAGLNKHRRFQVESDQEDSEADNAELREAAAEDEEKKPDVKRKRGHSNAAWLALLAIEHYSGNTDYRLLFDSVADLFAELLKSDVEKLKAGQLGKIGLAAKWCPSPGFSFDRSTLLCEAIAKRMFPKASNPEYADLSDEHYAYAVLRRLRRQVLVPLRKILELPEVYMSAQRWNELPYARVASVAMKHYKKLFEKHDESRFKEYIEAVEAGKAKIAAGALMPHEIAAEAYRGNHDAVAEAQWQRMVDDVLQKGTLSNCIAVCDVSGSMDGLPMEVCVALGVLVSELSEEPWKGKVITFSDRPQIHKISGERLCDKMSFVKTMDWDGSTNFQGVFDRILQTATENGIPGEKMVRRIFVFSDMEFNQASYVPWETDYQAICRKYEEPGYGAAVPELVFWNLRDSRSTPVTAKQKGVALVSGFSKNMMKVFLDGGEMPDLESVMRQAIAGEEYQKLIIVD